jgi:uncharacterized protein (DUF2062 family)
MPKKFIKRFLPTPETLKAHPHLRHFSETLQNPNLWHLNRRSVAGAVSVGLFCAWMPIPFQMVLAAVIAMLFTVNLPISVALVWLSNPITMPPLFYGAYRLGAFILQEEVVDFHFQLSLTWLAKTLETIAPPLLLGCFIMGTICSILGYVLLRIFWRVNTTKKWQRRNRR